MDDDSKNDVDWGESDPTPPPRSVFRTPPTPEPEPEPAPASEAPPPISPVLHPLHREEEKPASASASASASAEEGSIPPSRTGKGTTVSDEEPFDRPNAQKLGIIGGRMAGKTYLFQAMVYRCFFGLQSGALTYYLKGMHLFEAVGEVAHGGKSLAKTGMASEVNSIDFIAKYLKWEKLATTVAPVQKWYRLRLLFRSGLVGTSRSAMDVEYFDASGEGLLGLPTLSPQARELWEKAYLKAQVMVFCFPLWAAFPDAELTDDQWTERETLIREFAQVALNYRKIRSRHELLKPVTSVLALTMADDRSRSSLRTLNKRWISPYMETPHSYLKQLQKGSGVASYIANARKVSESLHEEFASSRDARIARIPQDLDFGRGKPWIVPLSAIDGERLDDLEDRYKDKPDDPMRRMEARNAAPVPVHVELPLLVALCEQENALM